MIVTNNLEIIEAQNYLNKSDCRRARPAEVFSFTRELLRDEKNVNEIKRRLMYILTASELEEAANLSWHTDEPEQVQAIVRIASKILNRIILNHSTEEAA